MTIQFDAKLWKQGNSIIATIPKEIREMYDLKEEDTLRINARLVTKKELEEEGELRLLHQKYDNVCTGVLIHENENVAQLQEVFYNISEHYSGSGETIDIDKLQLVRNIHGIILIGRVLPSARDKKHYAKWDMSSEFVKKYLSYNEIMKLKTMDGKEMTVKRITFEDPLLNERTDLIKKVGFRGRLIET